MRAALVLALTLLPGGPGQRAPGAESGGTPADSSARSPSFAQAFDLRVLHGRARLAQGQEVRTLSASDEPYRGRGEAALGLGSEGLAELSWRSRASLRLTGPAELEWSTLDGAGDLQILVGAAGTLDLEARRGGVRLELSQGWRLEVGEAALQISQEPQGGWSVRHHGGRAVRVRSRIPREKNDWPRLLRSGERLRLPPSRRSG